LFTGKLSKEVTLGTDHIIHIKQDKHKTERSIFPLFCHKGQTKTVINNESNLVNVL